MRNPRSLRRPVSRRSQAGMTLIEIIVVIVLIGGILAVIGGKIIQSKGQADWKLAGIQVKQVAASIESYNSDVGSYPRTLEDLTKDPNISGWLGPYGGAKDLKDPWGKPLVYQTPGEEGPFDLMSYGKDGKGGGTSVDADIKFKP